MLSKRYLASVKNLPDLFQQIVKGTAPDNFNIEHLKSIGFRSSNDRAVIPLLKDLGFLTESGAPTDRYHAYRAGGQQAKAVMGHALLESYPELFNINENPTEADREAIKGRFKSAHNATDRVAEQQAATFFALLKLADLKAARNGSKLEAASTTTERKEPKNEMSEEIEGVNQRRGSTALNLGYRIEVHLPATKDIEVYNAIFKSLRENILD